MNRAFHIATLGFIAFYCLAAPKIGFAGEPPTQLYVDKTISELSNAKTVKWQKYGYAEGADYYADPDTVKRIGDLVYTKELLDQSKTAVHEASSSIDIVVYDCANRSYTNLTSINYSDRMGTGSATSSKNEKPKVLPIVVGTVAENGYNFACNFAPYVSPYNRFRKNMHNDFYMRQN